MTRSQTARLSLTALFLGAVSAAFVVAGSIEQAEARPPRPSEAEVLEMDLAFYQRRVARDSFAARDRAELARLYLQRARAGGGADADLERAERYARESLALRDGRNEEAYLVLASALMGQHRFAEARIVAERLVALDSTARPTRAMLGEILLELGEYREAKRTFGSLATVRTELSVAPRFARWEEIRGKPAEARTLLRQARAQALRRHGMPAAQLAWFHWRLADLALRHDRLAEAKQELEAGLALAPEDHRLLDGLARLAMARRRWAEAIGLGERAIAKSVDPSTLSLLALAHRAAGDSVTALDYERAISAAVQGQPSQLHRLWSLALLDRGERVDAVLQRAEREIQVRHDVYGWDLLAWSLHRAGRDTAAAQASARARAMGTRDAVLFYHAAMIQAALGRPDSACAHLSTALTINPHWHPFQPDDARRALACRS